MDIRALEKQSQGEVPPPLPIFLDHGVKAWDEQNLQHGKANELLELLILHPKQLEATKRIRNRLQPKIQQALKQLLVDQIDVFAYNNEDVLGIDNVVTKHYLCVDLESRKVQQKRRSTSCCTVHYSGPLFRLAIQHHAGEKFQQKIKDVHEFH